MLEVTVMPLRLVCAWGAVLRYGITSSCRRRSSSDRWQLGIARPVPLPQDTRSAVESSRYFCRSGPFCLSSFFRKLFIYMRLSAEEEISKGSAVKETLAASFYAENKADWPGSFQIRCIKWSSAAEARATSRVSTLLVNRHILVVVLGMHPLCWQPFCTRRA